uniref:Collectin-12 n=1 Tax=Magallana gigas TaxID=29159 RepID=K1QC58_MAGGI|eukprot:XP_011436573.1 PREDICTED: perlucin-like protein [Crassostrea gigas]
MESPRSLLLCLITIGLGTLIEGCDDGWVPYKNNCYWFSRGTDLVFHNAVNTCSDKGSHLIELKNTSEEKWVLLQSLIRRYGHVWLGLTDVSREGRYVYSSTGVKPRYLNWHRKEPAGGKGENCAVLVTTQRVWHDYPCTSKMSYVCKKPEKRMDLNSNYCK